MLRKNFLQKTILDTAGLFTIPLLFQSHSAHAKKNSAIDQLPAEKVKEFVIAGHRDLTKVKSMLQELPGLLYATWDWGGGDFETALEGAGHVGDKEIANFLITTGARANLFVLTMLGKTQIVKAYLDIFPEYIKARGPHGLTFLHHAQRGGEDSKELLEYFQSKGLTETKLPL